MFIKLFAELLLSMKLVIGVGLKDNDVYTDLNDYHRFNFSYKKINKGRRYV